MPVTLLTCRGGSVMLPVMPLLDRADGGHLWVNPQREVWERTALTPDELTAWSFLIAATAQAMFESLPQLVGGCINYWEAGNRALNDAAEPSGPKDPRESRKVHMHLFGRGPRATHPDWHWGESPRFPDFANAKKWAAGFSPLDANECGAITSCARHVLRTKYGVD